jgi:hypothetical protein
MWRNNNIYAMLMTGGEDGNVPPEHSRDLYRFEVWFTIFTNDWHQVHRIMKIKILL